MAPNVPPHGYTDPIGDDEMAVTTTPQGALIITGEHIQVYRLLALRRGLMLEIKGINLRISAYRTIKREFNLTGTKSTVLAKYEELLTKSGVQFNP